MTMHACKADGAVYAIGLADTGDPTRVTPALEELQSAMQRNLGGQAQTVAQGSPTGATPNRSARRIEVVGRLADGTPVREQAAFFVKGTHIYQAVVLGERLEAAALKTFFDGLRLL